MDRRSVRVCHRDAKTPEQFVADPLLESFGAEWHAPSVFWFVGVTDPDRYPKAKEAGRLNEIPTNHNPRFAPVIHPTLQTGVEALIVAARTWLAP